MPLSEHERMQESLALLKLLALSDRRIDAGQVQPARDVIARLRERYEAARCLPWTTR